MKKTMSKAISILLVALMLVAMFPVAFAAEPTEAATVTVSMLSSNFTTSGLKFGGNGSISDTSGYTITWNDNSAVFVREESSLGYFRQVYGLVDGKKPIFALPAGHYTTAQFTFKTKIPEAGHYAVSLTPILSQLGGTYGVYVNDQYAGSVNSWNGIEGIDGWTSTTTGGDEVTLNTLKLIPDAEGYVKVSLKNLSTVLDTTIADSYKDAYNVPLGFQEFKLTKVDVVGCTGITENISGAELYVDKTLDFVIAPVMSDGSTRYFDASDANSTITASVADGSSVELSKMVMKADGLHGKLTAVSAEAATINVAVTLSGVTTNHTINVTPIAALVPVTTTVSLFDREKYEDTTHAITTTNINSGNGSISSGHTIVWEDGKTEYVADKTTITTFRELILKNAASGATVNHGIYKWPIGLSTADTKFTFRTKLADATYKVSMVPVISMRGCTYGVYVNGQYAGKVDTYEAHAGDWYTNAYANASVSLNTLDIKGDAQGWVEVTIKKLSVPDGNTSGYSSLGFKDITFAPTDALEVASLSENISTTDIYKGETYDFVIKAVMNDGQIHKFDTSNTADKITASAGGAVTLSNMEMKEDGLYGKITGVGEDEKATITVKTTINGVTATKTINAISFAKEIYTPEKIEISMVTTDVTHNKPDGYNFTADSEITWANNDKVRLDKDNTTITYFREYPYRANISYAYLSSPQAGTEYAFAMKVRAAAGTYKVDLTYPESIGGCKYEVIIDGTSVGTVDCSGTSEGWYEPKAKTDGIAELSNVTVTPDEDGWVSVKLKYLEEGANTTHATARALFFTNITLTPTAKVYVSADTPSEVNDVLITCEGDYEVGTIANVPFKSNLVFTANDTETNKFLYWINNSNKQVISEEATLALSVTSNASISAVYAESGNTRYDYFSAAGERLASYFGSAPSTEPEIPSAIGYVSGGEWSDENSYETDDYVAYAPDYTNAEALTFETTIDGEAVTVTYDEEKTVTAEESNFSYWTKGGKAVSFMKSYTFFVWGSEAVEKVCGVSVTANDRKPQVVLFNRGNDYMLELVACEDVEIIEKGILFAENGTPTISSTITKAKSNTDSKQFTATSTYAVARAYLVYRDDEGVKVVYSK